jgi:hypothetical protein
MQPKLPEMGKTYAEAGLYQTLCCGRRWFFRRKLLVRPRPENVK